MNPLAWNLEIPQRMRTKPQIALGILPLGLMFASFGPLFLLAQFLSSVFGIPENAPVIEQSNGMLWLILFLVSMVILMITGYLLGWVLNAMILVYAFKWSKEKTSQALLYSEVPSSWLKESYATDSAKMNPQNTWVETRKMGKARFILQRGVLAWGVPMFFIMAVLPATKGTTEITFFYFCWQGVLWAAAGAIFGFLIWFFSEKSFLKQNENQKP